MSVDTFKASHCGESFAGEEGAKALEAHMKAHRAGPANKGAHPVHAYFTPSSQPSHKAPAWRAPKAPTDTRKLTEILSKVDASSYSPLIEWSTPERDVPVIDLQAGDVFMWAGRVYDVTAIEGDTLQLTIRKSRDYPKKSAALTFDQIMSKTEVVSIIKRAA